MTYFYYALPTLLTPHILHLLALGLATSSLIAGKAASRWRTFAAMLGSGLAVLGCFFITTYDWKANARATRPEEYVHFHWQVRSLSGAVIAFADAALAALMYLSSTNRFFVVPATSAERMEVALKGLEQARVRLNAVGIIRNTVARDEGLRRKTDGYWVREGQVMGQIMDEREVLDGVRNALSGRVHVATVEAEARKYAEGITALSDPPLSLQGGPVR